MKEQELLAEIQKLREDYLAAYETMTVKEIQSHNSAIEDLQSQLSDLLSEDAINCPNCGAKPYGILKTPVIEVGGAIEKLPIYEVGCIVCPPFEKDGFRISYGSRGNTPEKAVENWNKGLLISVPTPK